MLRSALQAALASVKDHLGRSILSAIGIMVGTMAVMLLISIAKGVREDVRRQVDQLGGNVVIVLPGMVDTGTPFGSSGNIGVSPFTPADEQAVRGVPGVLRTAKWTFVGGTVTAGGRVGRAFPFGVDPTWFDIRRHKFSEGRPFTSASAREAVIGPEVKDSLFGAHQAVGKTVTVNGVDFVVVGVTEEQGSSGVLGANPFSIVVYLPFQAVADTIAKGKTQIDRILVQTDPGVRPKDLKERVRQAMLRSQGGQQTFSVLTQDDLLEAIYQVLNILTYLVVGISTIALFVGGVGIMTVMLMNVGERKREIGIRKTVGARKSDVFLQFLTEAVVLTGGGGLLGLAATYGAILLIVAITPIRPLLTPEIVALGFGLSIGVGCVFGLVPAIRAAGKEPVEAMRHE